MSSIDSSAHCRILVIDDDEDFRSFVMRFLAKNGFEPLGAVDGQQGLSLAAQAAPDLVLCDLEMPEMDGYQFLAALQRDPTLTSIPVIFLTGRSEPAQVRLGMNLGADDYLTKPVNTEDLCNAIKARLARVRRRQSAAALRAPLSRAKFEDTFLVKTHADKRLVKIREIIRILAYGEYSWVYWEGAQGAMLRKSLKQWLADLPEEQFIRVHRGAIVNLAYLERIENLPGGRMQVRLRDTAEPILVSLRLAPALNRKLKCLQPQG
jgi:DNA-binding LytR/AlgR family response regulator